MSLPLHPHPPPSPSTLTLRPHPPPFHGSKVETALATRIERQLNLLTACLEEEPFPAVELGFRPDDPGHRHVFSLLKENGTLVVKDMDLNPVTHRVCEPPRPRNPDPPRSPVPSRLPTHVETAPAFAPVGRRPQLVEDASSGEEEEAEEGGEGGGARMPLTGADAPLIESPNRLSSPEKREFEALPTPCHQTTALPAAARSVTPRPCPPARSFTIVAPTGLYALLKGHGSPGLSLAPAPGCGTRAARGPDNIDTLQRGIPRR